jgi:signal transduction histidine kinase
MLTAISGYAELLDRQLPPDHRGHGDLAEVLRAAERARALTRQLLAFGRKQVLQPQLLDVNDVVTDMVSMLRHLLGEDITIELSREATGKVLADRSQLEQVLVNLAVNARDAMLTGGVLAIRTSDVELGDAPVGAGIPPTPGHHVLLSVSDTGAGMDAATRAHAFEPFFTTKPHGKGTGMGLAQVYGTVKQSGGVIACESEPDRGTTMRIYLPAVAAPGEAEPPEPRAARAMHFVQEPAQTAP